MIGVFDSGVGGLAVLRHIHRLAPELDTVYLADQAYTPYGDRTPAEIIERAELIVDELWTRGCELIVVACNTATAAAVDALRVRHPDRAIVGMEPAIKPAAAMTTSGVIGVLATAGTLGADRYAALADRYGDGIAIVHQIGHGLAMAVESGREHDATTLDQLALHADAFTTAGADVVVLGCTHYSFFAESFDALGPFTVLDPAEAVARHALDRLEDISGERTRRYLTSSSDTTALSTRIGNSEIERVDLG